MKLLYIANERRSAVLAVTALRSIAPEVAITWAGHWSVAIRWVLDNRDLAAIVVEAEVQNQNCTSFVSEVRRLGLTAPVIVVVSEEVGVPLAALEAGADEYVSSQSLLANLPGIVGRAVQRAQATAQPTREPQALQHKPESDGLAETARTEGQLLEMQLVSARAHKERVEREYAAARQAWEGAREHLQVAAAAAAAEAVHREHLERTGCAPHSPAQANPNGASTPRQSYFARGKLSSRQ
jgi:DNA-binding response OmpR family regulator